AQLAARLGVDGEAFAAIASDDYAALSRAADALLGAIRAREPDAKRREERGTRAEEPLREVRRDALAAFLVHSLEPRLFATRDDLQPHFLIDVQSGGCLTTSRVVAAISSVQLYVHRVIMNLEASAPDAPDHLVLRLPESAAAEWTWRKNYRVWEANRKVFLWPENYIEPDLRDDKTPLFEELEAELLQTEISDQNVLDAYTKYLKGFEELASLTIAGAYHDVRTEGERTIDVLHLFGVSAADPPVFYHRTCENLIASGRDPKKTAVWSPWQKIEVQITGRRLSPVVFRGRLHVFWADYKTRPVNQVEEGGSRFAGYRHTMSVRFTTLRQDGTWSAPQAVLLPSSGEFGPGGSGAISDPLSGPKPLLDDRPHPEPMDDYTVSGPNWDWLWLEPASVGGRQVLTMRYRDFLEFGEIDLYRRRVIPGFINLATDPAPRLLCERAGTLHYGSPQYWNIVWRWGRTPTANLVVDDERLAVLSRENSVLRALLEPGLFVEAIASLAPGTELLAIPGSVEDGILQVGPDVILLQGSVTPGDDYVLRRIGTTLAEELGYRLFADGVDGLLDIETQKALREAALPLTPLGSRIDDRGNAGRLDLTGPYGVYYREIFFHVPFLIANALNGRGQFAAAQRWYHYIFDATSTEVIQVPPGTPPEERARRLLDRVWRYVEFRNLDVTRLRETLTDENALAVYHDDPFNPHAIARLRLSAYQKAVVMKYVDNLVDWADHLFTQFTMESVNEALMLYVMAADILGPRPARLGDCGEGAVQPKTYETIAPTLGAGEELLVELESFILASRMRARRRKTPVGPVRPHFTPDRGTLVTARRFAPLRRPGIEPAGVVVIGDGGVFGGGRFGGLGGVLGEGGVFEGGVLEDPTRGGT
ncbi:MAG: neuraminidase-like domain-containing protein, partial [Candidatus Eiseniibacteriota bacterium]